MSGLRERYGALAVVTGASDGIGAAFARALAAEGMSLLLVSRRVGRLTALAEALSTAHGIAARPLAVDLASPDGVGSVIAATAGEDVGMLVAAAGFGTSGAFLDGAIEEEIAMLDVNCRAVLSLTHAFAGRFAARGRGGIVLFSSLVAFQGVPGAAHYAATKAYVQSLAEGLAPELRPRGVDLVATAPGPVRSGFAARARMRMGATDSPETVARGTLAALGRRTTVRPGLLSKALEASLSMLPRRGRVAMMGRVMAGMTRPRPA